MINDNSIKMTLSCISDSIRKCGTVMIRTKPGKERLGGMIKLKEADGQ